MSFLQTIFNLLISLSMASYCVAMMNQPASSPSHSSQTCSTCSPIQHPNQQCNLPTECSHGRCIVELNRCTAEWLQSIGHNINWKVWNDIEHQDDEVQNNSEFLNANSKVDIQTGIVTLEDGREIQVEPETAKGFLQLVNMLKREQANINSLGEEFEDSIGEIDSLAGNGRVPPGGMHATRHLNCQKCGETIWCNNDSLCNSFYRGSWCDKPKGQSVGRCVITIFDGRLHTINKACCYT